MKIFFAKKRGMTLVEVLLILAVVGLVLTVLVMVLNSKQIEIRDLKRIKDMRAFQGAFSVVKNEQGSYLRSFCQPGVVSACAGQDKSLLNQYLPTLANINDPNGVVNCSDVGFCESSSCNYTLMNIAENEYEIRFHLEKGVDGYSLPGCYRLTERGIDKL